MRALSYVEIDTPYCANTYGTAPCTAAIGTTGSIKCFNTVKTCQDRPHYVEAGATLRFAMPAEYLPHDIEAIPSIADISFTPAIISLGQDLGQRATLQITFTDHRHPDTGAGFDKYLASRPYNPFLQGTFFGKFRARQPFLRGQPLRWINGYVGQALADMETRHYVVESFDGPTPDGKYVLIATDILKLADGDRAQAPAMSQGFLVADITATATAATLSPAGIGNSSYPASGVLNIGGSEMVTFTRAGDALTITRGQLNTVGVAHKAQDRCQVALQYTGKDAADIIRDLFVTYAGVPSSYIDLAAWKAETAAFLGNVYTSTIAEPTSVDQLVSELIEQAALAIWWDDLAQKLRLQVLRAVVTDAATFTPDNTLQGTLTTKEQPDQRLSRVQTYFGQINPLAPLSNLDNYRSNSVVIDASAESDYGSQAIKTIQSRWIAQLGRTVADRLGAVILGRFRDPPRHVSFEVMRYAGTDIALGQGYRVQSKFVQDATGAQSFIPIQTTQLNLTPDRFIVDAEEMLFSAPPTDLANRAVVIDANNYNLNLRTSHDSIFPAPTAGVTVTFTILAGVLVGSHSASIPSIDVGTWPAGVTLILIVHGLVQGMGGGGGSNSHPNGFPGGIALYTRRAISLDVASGQIWGGGGGGTYPDGGGGGGAGQDFGLRGTAKAGDGTATTGGAGYLGGGAGGGPGLPGLNGGGSATPGAAGSAIDGVSFVTVTAGPGDIRGPQIN